MDLVAAATDSEAQEVEKGLVVAATEAEATD